MNCCQGCQHWQQDEPQQAFGTLVGVMRCQGISDSSRRGKVVSGDTRACPDFQPRPPSEKDQPAICLSAELRDELYAAMADEAHLRMMTEELPERVKYRLLQLLSRVGITDLVPQVLIYVAGQSMHLALHAQDGDNRGWNERNSWRWPREGDNEEVQE